MTNSVKTPGRMPGICLFNEVYTVADLGDDELKLMYGLEKLAEVPPLPGSTFAAKRGVGYRRVAQGADDLQVVGTVDGVLPVPTGLVLFVGPADVGKTPLAMHVADRLGGVLVKHGEPFPGFTITREELAMQVLEAAQMSDVIVVDSLKDLARDSSGAAMSDGLNSGFFTMMSQWSALFASYGKSLVVPVNFATSRDDAIKSALQSIKSNATMLAVAVEDRWEWVMRTSVGAKRSKGAFNVQWKSTDGGINKLVDAGKLSDSERQIADFETDIGVFVTANPDVMQNSIKRAARQHS